MAQDVDVLLQQIGAEAEANMNQAGFEAMVASDFFCEYWDEIKKAIEFLGSLGGAWGKYIAKALVLVGDLYYKKNCAS